MKMKLAQRIAMGYYSTKFRTIGFFSPKRAAASAFELFCTPYSGKPKRIVPPVFSRSVALQFHLNGLNVHGFEWLPSNEKYQQTILICHGFDSSSFKFDQYIVPLLNANCRVLAFDAPGHGKSDGKTVNALIYRDTIITIEKQFGKLDAIIAHSLGGLAAALAMETLPDQQNRKLVLIAPATETSRAIHNFFRFIPVHQKTRNEFNSLVEQIAENPIEWLSIKRCIQHIDAKILWVHDETDWVCPFEDVVPIIQQKPANIEFLITKGLGHSGIYRNQKVHDSIMYFLTERPDTQ
jgi:predicted alpha/beta hydrolase family esterase